MSRRLRAAGFLALALGCAAGAAALASGYGAGVAEQLGELRPVVVAAKRLDAGEALRPRDVARSLEVRRVPERFAPPDALGDPSQALGRAPATRVPAGSYVLGSQLAEPRPRRRTPRIGSGRRPVEVAVAGAGALALAGGSPTGSLVDVVVVGEPSPGARGRARVVAERVKLLALREGGKGGDIGLPEGEAWIATLALTRVQALQLIEAESFARQVRLIPRSGS